MSKCLGGIIGCKDEASSWHVNGPMVLVTLGQQYNVGEKLIIILCTYINRHAGTPNKIKPGCCSSVQYTGAECVTHPYFI